MKKRDLLLASSLLLGFGLTAQAQQEEQLFFYGFEDNLASFTDSTHPLDSIMKLRYYDVNGAVGTSNFSSWTLDPVEYDTTLYLLHGIQTYGSRGDAMECIHEDNDEHQMTFNQMGAEGGHYYFKYTAGASDNESADYQGCIFIRNIPIEDETSYRLVYYRKSSGAAPKMYTGILRGFYNSEKSISMNGASGNEFMRHDTDNFSEDWQRVTVMQYYQNDSVANTHCYNAGYWWTGSWTRTAANGEQRVYIEQPDKFFVRLTFSGSGCTYYVDDIALYKSWIGGAESNGDIIRINFGYDTNLGALANASALKAVELPSEYFTVTGIDSAYCEGEEIPYEPMDVPVLSAEYHNDGYLYIQLDDNCDYYGNVRVSFTNPVNDASLALKYTGSLYPKSLDTAWVNAGKFVPDFTNEFVVPNLGVNTVFIQNLAPTAMSTTPDNGSFQLQGDMRSIKVFFNKKVYTEVEEGVETELGVLARMTAPGFDEIWLPGEYDESDQSVTFTRQDANTSTLVGDYEFTIVNARANAGGEAAENKTFSFSFGNITGGAPVTYLQTSFADCVAEGLATGFTLTDASGNKTGDNTTVLSGCSRMKKFAVGSDFESGIYLSPRGNNGGGHLYYGKVSTSLLTLEPGEYYISFKGIGWTNISSKDIRFLTYSESDTILDTKIRFSNNVNSAAGTGVTLSGSNSLRYTINITESDNYILEWTLEDNSWDGVVISDVSITNVYSESYVYINKVNTAYQTASDLKTTFETALNKYSGTAYNKLCAVITQYTGFTSTSPLAYDAAEAALKDSTSAAVARKTLVDNYYTEYANAEALKDQYAATDSIGMADYVALVQMISDYAEYSCPANVNDSVVVLTNRFKNAMTTLNNRLAANGTFATNIQNIEAIFAEKSAYSFFAEYTAAQEAYNQYKDIDMVSAADADVTAANTALAAAVSNFNGKLDGALAMSSQVKNLAALATTLGVDLDNITPGLSSQMENILVTLAEDNQELATAYKLAIKAQIYENIANGAFSDSIDLSSFITNGGLYSTATVGVDMSQYYYSYGIPNDRWRITSGTAYSTVFPGWTMKSNGGNVHVGNETRNWIGASPVFDAWVAADWSSSFEMTTEITDLPIGVYSIGAAYNNNQDGAYITASYTYSDSTYRDTVVVKTGSQDYTATPTAYIYNFPVNAEAINVKLYHPSVSAWARVDNFSLIFSAPVSDLTVYAGLAAQFKVAAQNAFAEATDVEEIVGETTVKYYNLSGIAIDAPQKGSIVIRVTTDANGNSVSETVLF